MALKGIKSLKEEQEEEAITEVFNGSTDSVNCQNYLTPRGSNN